MNHWAKKDFVFLFLIVVLATLLDFGNASKRTYFGDFDEFLSVRGAYFVEPVEQSKFLFSWFRHAQFEETTLALPHVTPENGNALGYLWVLKLWMRMFGCSDFSARLLSVFFHLLFCVASWTFCRSLFSNRAVFWVCTIGMAFNPVIILTACMIRGYALSAFLALCATLLLLKWLKEQKTYLMAMYIGILVFAFTVHYLSSVVLGAHLVFVFLMKDQIFLKRKLFAVFGITLLLVGIFFLLQSKGVNNMMKATTASAENQQVVDDKQEQIKTARKIKETTINSLGYSSIQYLVKYYYGMPSLYSLSLFFHVNYISVYVLIPPVLLVLMLWLLVLNRYLKKQLTDIVLLLSLLSVSGFVMSAFLALVFGHILTLTSIKYSVFTAAYFLPLLLLFIMSGIGNATKTERMVMRLIFATITLFVMIQFVNLPKKISAALTDEIISTGDSFPMHYELNEFGKVSGFLFSEKDTLVFSNHKTILSYQFCVPSPKTVMRTQSDLSGNSVYLLRNDSLILVNVFPHRTAY